MTSLSVVFVCGFVVAVLLTPLFRRAAIQLQLFDRPNERSSHTKPTPRNGGMAILLGVAVAWAVGPSPDRQLLSIFLCGAAIAVVGAVDDIRPLSPSARFGAQLATALLLFFFAGLRITELRVPLFGVVSFSFLAVVVTSFWIVGATNAYNFMDGINGIASVEALICGTVLALLFVGRGDFPGAAASLALAGACAGFLPWNFPSGSIFMGDSGSGLIGFVLATLIVRLATEGVSFIAAALPLTPFLFDTATTLLRRIWRRENLISAHRSHYYQRMTSLGHTQNTVTATWALLALASATASLYYDRVSSFGQLVLLAIVMSVHAAVMMTIARLEGKKISESAPAQLDSPSS